MKKLLFSSLFILTAAFSYSQAKKIYASSTFVKGGADNSAKLATLIKNAPNKSTIIFPNGDYYFYSTDTVTNKALTFQGSEETRFFYKQGITALVFISDRFVGRSRIENISFRSQGVRFGTTGNGLQIHQIVDIENVSISNFGGYGLTITADIASYKTDASRSTIRNVEVAECGNGFHTAGGDANGISFYDCSARDNDGYGFNDDSFLGCNFYSPMAHANKLGGYRAMNGNNRTVFIAAYNEGGQPESEIGGVTYVFGGICGFGAGWKAMSPHVKIFQQ